MQLFKADGKSAPIPRGFLLAVDSWENDGDLYQTEFKHFDTEAEASMHLRITKVFADQYGNEDSIFSESLDTSKIDRDILEYIIARLIQEDYLLVGLLEALGDPYSESHEDALKVLCNEMHDISRELLGYSEHYACRVFDGGSVYALPDGVNLRTVEVLSKY